VTVEAISGFYNAKIFMPLGAARRRKVLAHVARFAKAPPARHVELIEALQERLLVLSI